MPRSKVQPFIGLCWLFLLPHIAEGQETDARSKNRFPENSTTQFGRDADHWLHELLNSQVDIDTRISLDRLSFFNLTPAQIEKLTAAAEVEESCEKRVLLWQAMRQCRDVTTRNRLIEVLLRSGSELQMRFLEELENPTRFDLPILVTLYTNQPTQGANTTAAHEALEKQALEKQALEKQALEKRELSQGDHRETVDSIDSNIVCQRIVEFATRTQWMCSRSRAGRPHPDDYAFRPMLSTEVEIDSARNEEAQMAQEQFVYWLIQHGLTDEHRLMAFEIFAQSKHWRERKSYANMGHELLKGLQLPESRAQAVRLVMPWMDPHKFLRGEESEIVRLRAIDAIHSQLAKNYADPTMPLFNSKMAVIKPIVAHIQSSDPSPVVREAATRLLERIAYCELHAPRQKQAVAAGPP